MTTITQLIGAADNSKEPMPLVNHRNVMIGIQCTGLVCAWICVSLRLYTRFRILKAQGWDDLFVTLAACSTTLGAVFAMLSTNFGLGQHILTLSLGQIEDYLQAFYVANATYPCSTAFIKLALLLQFARVYERGTRWWYCVMGLIVVTTLWGFAYGFLAWIPCIPVRAYWQMSLPATRYAYGTLDASVFIATYESHTAVNLLLDMLVFAVAAPMFWRGGMSKQSYWGLAGLFMLGAVVNMLSVWRLVAIVSTKAATYPTFDPMWYAPTAILLASLEADVATICASLPVFWPVIQKQISQIFVTREVKITREYRRPYSTSTIIGDEESGDNPLNDEFGDSQHLNRKASGTTTTTTRSLSLREKKSRGDISRKDSYAMRRVVPFDDSFSANRRFSKPILETRIEARADEDTRRGPYNRS